MKTAHQIVADYAAANAIDPEDFDEWFADGGYGEECANVHDSRHLALMEAYVEERDQRSL